MPKLYFNSDGRYHSEGDASVDENAIGTVFFPAEAPDVPRWRLTLDIETGVVTDIYEGLSTEEAEAQLVIDLQAKHEADVAAREAAQAAG